MYHDIDKIIVVLNSFEKIDKMLEQALTLSSLQKATLEILYVHEKSLFDLPDYFSALENIENNHIDKEKIKKEIKERLLKLGESKEYAILIFIDDTVDRVLTQIKDPNQTLTMITYHEKITEKLLKKSDTSFLIIKNDKKTYDNIIMPVDLSENSINCINIAKIFFPQSKIKLLYDNQYILLKEIKTRQKVRFEALKNETNLDGYYIEEHFVNEVDFVDEFYAIEKHLAEFIEAYDFDLTILYSHHKDFLFSSSISLSMLKIIQTDLLLLKKHHK